jgi:hypothetical protein
MHHKMMKQALFRQKRLSERFASMQSRSYHPERDPTLGARSSYGGLKSENHADHGADRADDTYVRLAD